MPGQEGREGPAPRAQRDTGLPPVPRHIMMVADNRFFSQGFSVNWGAAREASLGPRGGTDVHLWLPGPETHPSTTSTSSGEGPTSPQGGISISGLTGPVIYQLQVSPLRTKSSWDLPRG